MPSLADGSNKTDGRSSDNLIMATDKLKITNNMIEEVVDLDSDEDTVVTTIAPKVIDNTVKRIAKKSTATPELRQPPAASTRRQVALANSTRKVSVDRFMENFDPESSARERRKLSRKVNAVPTTTRKTPGAVYDENGIHILTGVDLCDCLQRQCPGCHFPCPKCRSTKCGPDCRCNRKYSYELLEYQGCDLVVRNPLNKQ